MLTSLIKLRYPGLQDKQRSEKYVTRKRYVFFPVLFLCFCVCFRPKNAQDAPHPQDPPEYQDTWDTQDLLNFQDVKSTGYNWDHWDARYPRYIWDAQEIRDLWDLRDLREFQNLETLKMLKNIDILNTLKTLDTLNTPKKLEYVGLYYCCCAQRRKIFVLNCGLQSLSNNAYVSSVGKSSSSPTDIVLKIMKNLWYDLWKTYQQHRPNVRQTSIYQAFHIWTVWRAKDPQESQVHNPSDWKWGPCDQCSATFVKSLPK